MDLINQLAEIAALPGLPIDTIPIPVEMIPMNVPEREHILNPKAIILIQRLTATYNPTMSKYPVPFKILDTDDQQQVVKLPGPMWSFFISNHLFG